jgi:thiamine-phosphate pyrophosphorylase
MRKIKKHSLYLVISEEYGNGRSGVEMAGAAIAGGVDMIQMREKYKAREELVRLGGEMSKLCKRSKVIFIVNDDPVLAKEVDADGAHLDQEDLKKYPLGETRRILGGERIIGISTHSPEEFDRANVEGVDYVAYGPIFPTKTKDYHLGTKDIKRIVDTAGKPVFFIGGINLANIDALLKEGAANIALIRDVVQASDITERTRLLKEKVAHGQEVKA